MSKVMFALLMSPNFTKVAEVAVAAEVVQILRGSVRRVPLVSLEVLPALGRNL
jgi:hypothetical protein